MKISPVQTTNKIALEDEISRTIMAENGCTAHFEYKDKFKNTGRYITVMTYNPNTKETFLLQEIYADSDEKGLYEIFEYVKNHKVEYDSFTVVWAKKGDGKQAGSYFYCKDALEAMEKFFFNKKREDYIIYEVKMSAKS